MAYNGAVRMSWIISFVVFGRCLCRCYRHSLPTVHLICKIQTSIFVYFCTGLHRVFTFATDTTRRFPKRLVVWKYERPRSRRSFFLRSWSLENSESPSFDSLERTTLFLTYIVARLGECPDLFRRLSNGV